MDLRPWLEHTFLEELLLGNSWLQDKNARKATGVKSEFDKAWALLYHDNGSVLDITNYRHPDQNCALQVVQTQPLTLSDGEYQISARLTALCSRDLADRFSDRSITQLGTFIAVRRYAIRYTSYGPPRDKLCFILDKVDWLGIQTQGISTAFLASLQLLHSNEQLVAILNQLHITRTKADRRRLRPATEQEHDEAAMARRVDHDANSPQTQRPATQVPFGTQLSHTIKPRPRPRPPPPNDEPVFLGINRMEPVSLGNVQQEEIRPKATTSDYDERMKLLTLLKFNPQSHSKPSSASPLRSTSNKQHHVVQSPSPAKRVEETIPRSQSSRTRTELEPVATSEKQRASQYDLSPLAAAYPENETSMSEDLIDQPEQEDLPMLASDCSWMAGFTFDRQSLQVSDEQRKVMRRDESWFKPEVGVLPFPAGNMPITLFTELRELGEEQTAADSDQDSDDDDDGDDDDDDDDMDIDLDSIPDSVSAEPVLDIAEDELPTSPVSWAATPTPEPPERPIPPRQGLPPDSSFEAAALNAKSVVAQEATSSLDQLVDSHAAIDFSNDKEFHAPPSSPPLQEQPADEDEDMEMETSVPQALGEDVVPNARAQEGDTVPHRSSSPKPGPFVQVKETPYTARQQNQADNCKLSPTRQIQDSSDNSKSISSTSIVHGTYNEQSSSSSPEDDNQLGQVTNTMSRVSENHISDAMKQANQNLQNGTEKEDPAHALTHAIMPVARQGLISSTNSVSPTIQRSPAQEPLREQHNPASGFAKRRIVESPTKVGKRHSKRREIKIVGFGSESRPHADIGAALRQEREESLKKFREARKARTSLEDQKSPIQELNKQQDVVPMDIDPLAMETGTRLPRFMSPRHKSLYEDSNEALSIEIQEQPQLSSLVNQSPSVTVFDAFKAAYPEYTGGTKHFGTLCKQMYELELEDKMVPKWQWDDFVIRNRTDYKDYAMDCADQGENPEPYYRFYKDTIRDTLHRQNVVGSKATLLKALEELDVNLPTPVLSLQPQKSPRKTPRKKKSSRSSLPGAFNQHKAVGKDATSGAQPDRTRSSFPSSSSSKVRPTDGTSSGHKPRAPAQPASTRQAPTIRPTTRPNLLERLSSEHLTSARSTPEPTTGDPFRDFVFGFQRTTSFTGSSKVDPRKSWPQNLAVRLSIADAPKNKKKKVDVLTWADTL